MWLKISEINWGPKPFRFNNCWLDHKDFQTFMESCWRDFQVTGWKGYILKEKMKMLKERLKWWNKEVFGIIDLKIDKTIEEINALDNIVVAGGQIDVDGRKLLFAQFWNQLHARESLLLQKSRAKWTLEGDANSIFFHICIQAKRRRNQVASGIKGMGNEWVEDVEGVKSEVKRHYEQLFSTTELSRPVLEVLISYRFFIWIIRV